MKHISESIIGRKGASVWPNPYGLTKEDAKGQVKGWPLEVITLALYEANLIIFDFDLEDLQREGLSYAFNWNKSIDGFKFWNSIAHGKFDVFYNKYTPETLK